MGHDSWDLNLRSSMACGRPKARSKLLCHGPSPSPSVCFLGGGQSLLQARRVYDREERRWSWEQAGGGHGAVHKALYFGWRMW